MVCGHRYPRLMLGIYVWPAEIQDREGCLTVSSKVRRLSFLVSVAADGGCQGGNSAAAVKRAAGDCKAERRAQGVVVLPKLWGVLWTLA
ncbi:hypothetical protein ABB55_06350 [Prosthecomicrobium hirschii]|uniref:Uncharacterized protein n=1 Tax=Prosthecodimorpha hirschii TaxID=665126 RepID=A0A0P6VYS2_9HYPH|nr:hypothetical protein ABB55_06350 [Prosthecomicrobium hirschii]